MQTISAEGVSFEVIVKIDEILEEMKSKQAYDEIFDQFCTGRYPTVDHEYALTILETQFKNSPKEKRINKCSEYLELLTTIVGKNKMCVKGLT